MKVGFIWDLYNFFIILTLIFANFNIIIIFNFFIF